MLAGLARRMPAVERRKEAPLLEVQGSRILFGAEDRSLARKMFVQGMNVCMVESFSGFQEFMMY